MKTKQCSFCNKEVSKLWYANPKCCAGFKCRAEYAKVRGKEKTSPVKGNALSSKGKVSKIRPMSSKMVKKLAEYRIVRDEFLKVNTTCWNCGGSPTECHHGAGRVGDLLTDVRYFVALCRGCHQRAEQSPEWAKEKGFSFTRLDK